MLWSLDLNLSLASIFHHQAVAKPTLTFRSRWEAQTSYSFVPGFKSNKRRESDKLLTFHRSLIDQWLKKRYIGQMKRGTGRFVTKLNNIFYDPLASATHQLNFSIQPLPS